jgi:Dockerin type I domain
MSRSSRRRLVLESLERRALMAADCHNLLAPLDVNDDAMVTPADALMVINRLNNQEIQLSNNPQVDGFIDVNDDGAVTPTDALKVINGLNDPLVDNSLPASDWLKVKGENESRVGVRMKHASDGSLGIEIRMQHAVANESKEVFLEDKWIGSIQPDSRGRGLLKIDSNNELADRVAELLMEGRQTATLVVDSIAQIELENAGVKNVVRSAENKGLLEGNVFSAKLALEGQHRGEVLYARRGDREFLGFYARGLTAEQSYDITIDGVVVARATASGRGVIAKRINVDDIENFPEIKAGTVVTIANYRGEFASLKDRLQIPKTVYFANLSGNGKLGSAELVMTAESTWLGLRLGRVEANTTYPIFVDDVKIAEVKSGQRGFLQFQYYSARGDKLLAELPTITENSVIRVGEIARGEFLKLSR